MDEFARRGVLHRAFSVAAPPPGKWIALDGVRGIAVLLVVALHSGAITWGWVGVDIFFVLSGFLITAILLDARSAGASGWTGYGKPFYIRRLLRIVPLAWTFLAILFWLCPALGITGRVPLGEQLWYWGFLSNGWLGFRSRTAWMAAHFWSLAVEEQFYLLWPWLLLITPRHKLKMMLHLLLVSAVAARIAVVSMHLAPQVGHVYQDLTVTRMDGLVAGSLVAVLAREAAGLVSLKRAAMMWLIACSLLFTGLETYAPTRQFGFVLRYSALAGSAASALLLVLGSPAGWMSRLLSGRFITWIGIRSYAIYVIHLPVALWLVRREFPAMLVLAGTLAVVLPLAALSWRFLEQPFLAHKARWPMPGRR